MSHSKRNHLRISLERSITRVHTQTIAIIQIIKTSVGIIIYLLSLRPSLCFKRATTLCSAASFLEQMLEFIC